MQPVSFWLHFDVKNPAIPLERRLERAHIMHRIDQIVGLIFLLMLPSGIILCYVIETPCRTISSMKAGFMSLRSARARPVVEYF